MPQRLLTLGQRQGRDRQRKRDAQKTRDQDPFYRHAQWRKLRAWMLRRQPVCQRCMHEAATEVHHIEPRTQRPDLALVAGNLVCLCKGCHSAETGRGG